MSPSTATWQDLLIEPQVRHGWTICANFMAWWSMYLVLNLKFKHDHRLAGWFKSLNREEQQDVLIRCVACIHALTILALAAWTFIREGADLATSLGAERYWATLCILDMVAYFYWDLTVLLFMQPSLAFFLHAVTCLFVYMVALYPFQQLWVVGFIFFEASTPFLHGRRMLMYLRQTQSGYFRIMQTGFFVAFTLTRIVIGVPAMLYWFYVMAHTPAEKLMPSWVMMVLSICAVTLSTLNVYWFSLLVKSLRKRHVA